VHRDGLQRSNERNRVGPPRESIVRREMVFRIKIRLASRPGPKTFFSKLLTMVRDCSCARAWGQSESLARRWSNRSWRANSPSSLMLYRIDQTSCNIASAFF
jgi:hypothetical protein